MSNSAASSSSVLSLYIPNVFANISEQKIKSIFNDRNIGVVNRVRFVPKKANNNNSPAVNKAYVYFDTWFNNIDAQNIQTDILNSANHMSMFYYSNQTENQKYWTLLENQEKRSNKPSSSSTASTTTKAPAKTNIKQSVNNNNNTSSKYDDRLTASSDSPTSSPSIKILKKRPNNNNNNNTYASIVQKSSNVSSNISSTNKMQKIQKHSPSDNFDYYHSNNQNEYEYEYVENNMLEMHAGDDTYYIHNSVPSDIPIADFSTVDMDYVEMLETQNAHMYHANKALLNRINMLCQK